MRKILCSIQQGAVPKDRILALEAALRNRYARHFGTQRLLVIWCEVPRGQAYTEGRLSSMSWLMVEVPDGLDQAVRERAMLAIADDWARVAQVSTHDLMVTLSDSRVFDGYVAANRNRIRPLRRVGFMLRTLAGLWSSRRRDGHASIAANY